jgi:inosine-uridine nucleoside N-ribohydrolase
MKKAIKRILKRIFVFIIAGLILYLIISNIDLIRELASSEKTRVLIDADAANGLDDVFSVLRMLEDEEVELQGLHSAQWRLTDLDNDSTVWLNQGVNRLILEHYRKSRIPHFAGSGVPLIYSGGSNVSENLASTAILRAVQDLPYGEKLNLLCLGSATNLASALLENPGISDKIICYIQGPFYDPTRRAWNKNDPVTRLDLEAMDLLLNNDLLQINLIPANVAFELNLLKSAVLEDFSGNDKLSLYIRKYIRKNFPDTDSIPVPGLALVEAFLNPDLATQKQLVTPPENTQRKIYAYTRVDTDRMLKDFRKSLEKDDSTTPPGKR